MVGAIPQQGPPGYMTPGARCRGCGILYALVPKVYDGCPSGCAKPGGRGAGPEGATPGTGACGADEGGENAATGHSGDAAVPRVMPGSAEGGNGGNLANERMGRGKRNKEGKKEKQGEEILSGGRSSHQREQSMQICARLP